MQVRTKPFRRTQILVDRRLQLSVSLHGVAYGGVLLLAVAIGIFAPLLLELGERAPNVPHDPEVVAVMLYMHQRFWFVAAGCLLLAGAGALRLSHRIAGPMVRYKRNLRMLANGQLPPPLRTRDNDFLQDEVSCLNQAVAGVSARIERVRAAHAALRRELDSAFDATRFGGGEIDPQVLRARCGDIEQALDEFVTAPDLDGYVLVPASEQPQLATSSPQGAAR